MCNTHTHTCWRVFSHKHMPWLHSQVSHCGDPFPASADPIHNLCLLRMRPSCLVPYPIILCPSSKNPCSPIVLLTCLQYPLLSPFIFDQNSFLSVVLFLWLVPLQIQPLNASHSLPTLSDLTPSFTLSILPFPETEFLSSLIF